MGPPLEKSVKRIFCANDKRYHCTELCLASTNIFCFKSPSINLCFPSAFLNVTNRPQYCGRPEMILTFAKSQYWNLWSMKSNFQVSNVQLLKFPLWTCTAERDRERIWRSRLRERQPGGYWIWLKDCKRNIAHPVKIRQRILLPDGSNYEKELKKIIFKLWPPSQHKLCSTTPDVVLKYVAIFFSSAFFKSESESNS